MVEPWGNTRWQLSCPWCGARWAVVGRGRWLERKLSPSGPSFPPVGDMITHTVERSELCEFCRDLADEERDDMHRAAAQLRALTDRIETTKTRLPNRYGVKVCVRCLHTYRVTRSDSCYCSPRCKKAAARRLERLRSGRPLSAAMLAHDWPWPDAQWEWWK